MEEVRRGGIQELVAGLLPAHTAHLQHATLEENRLIISVPDVTEKGRASLA